MERQYDILTRISKKYDKMSKGHKTIANFISEHYDQAVFMTAAKLGSTLGISESTVVRFASELGYDGYLQERSSASSAFTPDFTKGEIYDNVLSSLIHELTHYYQWIEKLEQDDYASENQADYYRYKILDKYYKETNRNLRENIYQYLI